MHTNSDTVTVPIVSECRPGPTLPTFPTQNVKLRVKLKAALKSSSPAQSQLSVNSVSTGIN